MSRIHPSLSPNGAVSPSKVLAINVLSGVPSRDAVSIASTQLTIWATFRARASGKLAQDGDERLRERRREEREGVRVSRDRHAGEG